MKPKLSKYLIMIFALMCILTFISMPQTTATPAKPKISVEPAINSFTTDVTKVGDTFVVKVSTSGWEAPGLYSFEFKLKFDPTLLDVVKAEYPAGHFFDFTPDKFMVTPVIDTEKGYVLFGGTLLGEVGATGSGTFAQVTLKIIKAPPPALSCNLEIADITFLDPEGNTITTYDVEHGYYEFTLPKAPVYLKVTPSLVGAAKAGEIVKVNIVMNDLRAVDKLIAVQWKLEFDPSLLKVSEVAEGDFLKSEAEKAKSATGQEYGTAFDWEVDTLYKYVISFTLYYRVPWPPERFPEGSGTLATITFVAIRMPTELTEITLKLYDVMLLDVEGNEIAYNRLEDGKYIAPILLGDLNLDRKVDIQDLYLFGRAFGTTPDHPRRWDARADVNSDGKVNIIDGIIIAKNFGKSLT